MAYSTQANVEREVGGAAKLVQLTAAPGGAAVVADVLNAAIAEADGIIDSYAGKRYAVPIAAPVPAVIRDISARIAARSLRRGKGMPHANDESDQKEDNLWLIALSKGEVSLGIEPAPAKSELLVDQAGTRDTTKSVSRDKLKGFW